MKLFILLSFILATKAFSSSFIECDITGTIQSISDKKVTLTISQIQDFKTGFGQCQFKPGSNIFFDSKESLSVGEKITIKYYSYSDMGPEGPVSGEKWENIRKIK
jgi:hypothetical protein